MDILPTELHVMIFDYLDDCTTPRFVCRQWRDTIPHKLNENYTQDLARKGYLDLLKWASKNGCRIQPKVCTRAAESGHLDILEWLLVGWTHASIHGSTPHIHRRMAKNK